MQLSAASATSATSAPRMVVPVVTMPPAFPAQPHATRDDGRAPLMMYQEALFEARSRFINQDQAVKSDEL